MAEDNISLGRFQLVGIRPAPRGIPQIEVMFALDADGIVHVSAKDFDTGKEQSIKITAKSGLTREEVEKIIAEADAYKQEDERRRQAADIKSQVSGLIYTIERTLMEVGDSVNPSQKEEVQNVIAGAKASLGHNDVQLLQGFIEKLSDASSQINYGAYAHRNPTLRARSVGSLPPRAATRRLCPYQDHPPPRSALVVPYAGPGGLLGQPSAG